MDGNFFFVIAGVLVLAAVGISFVGIRGSDSFPPNRGVLLGVVALFVLVVGTTMAFAIVKSVDEQNKRNDQLAKEQPSNTGETQPATPGGQPQAGAAETFNVSSPADGSTVFQPNGLQAKPGNVTITYTNPSPVSHSIAVATANGNVLGQVQPFTNGKRSLSLTNLAPGKYVFYCTVPGHREAGMQGDLTVTGGPTP
ncbi:MAG: cupredoxin domain-containing protein [Solirubrobacterales bacterium]